MPQKELLLSRLPGWRETIVIDDDRPDDLIIKTYCDPTPHIERAGAIADEAPGKDFRHVAVVPPDVWDRALRDGWANDQKAWNKWANDGSNAYLRTWKGRL
jgi:hypothetical protein